MFKKILIPVVCILVFVSASAQTATQIYNKGVDLVDQKKYSEALSQFKKAITLNANYKEAFYYAGWCSIELKKYTESLTYLQKAKSLWPNEAKVYREIGYANEKLNKLNLATDNYKKSIDLQKDNPLAYKYLAYLYYDAKRYEDALVNFDWYINYTSNITDEDIYYTKGYCENESGKYNDALSSLAKALKLAPNMASTNNEMAYAHLRLGNAEDALSYYSTALEINPKSTLASNGIAEVYRTLKKDIPEAIKKYQVTIDIDPKNKTAYYWIGWCYNDLGKYNEAVPILKKAIEIDANYVSAITELGYSDYALKNYDDALYDFKRSMNIKKTELNVYYSGLCYVGKKQKTEAQKMVQELKTMDSDYAQTLQDKIDKM